MMRVGQCESCESWLFARDLRAARVVRPTIGMRERLAEVGTGVAGLDESWRIAWFCEECVEVMTSEKVLIRPGDAEFHAAPARARREGAAGPRGP